MMTKLKSRSETGITLVIVLVMLMLVTLLTLTSFLLSKENLQVVGNMQLHDQVRDAAQATIETTISKPSFTTIAGLPQTTSAAVGGSTTNDIKIITTSSCVAVQPIPNSSLNLNDPSDAGCVVGANQQSGITGSNSTNSMCANSLWDIQAIATDLSTNATTTIDQGEAIRVPVATTCP